MGSNSLGTEEAPSGEAAVLTGATRTWVHIGAIQVQAVRTGVIARSRRPIAPVAASITHRRAIDAARVKEVVWIRTNLFTGGSVGCIGVII